MITRVIATLGTPLEDGTDTIDLEVIESTDSVLLVKMPLNPYPPLSVNSIPYYFLNWNIGIFTYPADSVADVFNMVSIDGETATLNNILVANTQSYLAIVAFVDESGVCYPDVGPNGLKHPLAPILIADKSGYNVIAPQIVEGDSRYPQKPTEPLLEDEEYIFAGWGNAESGAIYGAGNPIPVKLRTFMFLKPTWVVGFKDHRYATAMFSASAHGSFKDSEGNVLDSWNISNEYCVAKFDSEYKSAHAIMKSSTFVIPHELTFIADAEGDWSIPRFISSWVRVDGGELVDPLNDMNNGFYLSDEVSGKVFAGDHYGDIFYPNDTLMLREGESARFVPIWAYAYTYRVNYDLTQFKTLVDEADENEPEGIDKDQYLSELMYWMSTYDITPIYDESGEFTYKGFYETTCAKKVLWTRLPSAMPPCVTYFKKWVTKENMFDISTKFVYGGWKDEYDSWTEEPPYLAPCPGQRVGMQIENGYRHECTLKAEWCPINQSIPWTALVYDDPEWVEPTAIEGIDKSTLVDMPHSHMVEGILYADPDKPSEIILDFRVKLAGTGKNIGTSSTQIIDTRPKGNGLYSLVKSFENWNIRLNADRTSQTFQAGDSVRIIVSGNVMASYYWGEFPGPMNELTGPPQISRAWKFFKSARGQSAREEICWNDVIIKKAVWGPQLSGFDSEDTSTKIIESTVYPDVIFAEASWRTQTGAYLIFGDYAKVSSGNTENVPILALPCIQSIQDSVSNSLSEISTVAYGYENRFIMDVGTTRSISIKISRINPPDYYDGFSEADDPTEYYDSAGRLLTGAEHPSKKNKFFYADHWSNSKWYAMLRQELNFWQNSLNANNKSVYGGVQIYYSPPALNPLEVESPTMATLSSSRPFYPNMLYNVFMTGSISPSYNGQMMTLSIPLTLSKMVTSEEATGSQETTNNWCILYPYMSDYVVGAKKRDEVQNVDYIDSFNATRLIRTVSRTSTDTWLFTAPATVEEWTASRAYYEIDATEPYQTNIPLAIIKWHVKWHDNGLSREATLSPGAQIDLGKAPSVSLFAEWSGAIETVTINAQTSFIYRDNHLKNNDDRFVYRQYDSSKYIGVTYPEGATRMTIQMCGGGGGGGQATYFNYNAHGSEGGGGAGGQRLVLNVDLSQIVVMSGILIRVGRGGRRVSDEVNGESTVIKEYALLNDLVEIDEPYEPLVSRTWVALGGPGGTTNSGGRYESDVSGVANGGNPSGSKRLKADDGESLGEFKGGVGGDSRYSYASKLGGGGGGGACNYHVKLRYREKLGGEYKQDVVKSSAGKGCGGNLDYATDGEFGGGGGGGQSAPRKHGKEYYSKGGSGAVFIQFFGGGS